MCSFCSTSEGAEQSNYDRIQEKIAIDDHSWFNYFATVVQEHAENADLENVLALIMTFLPAGLAVAEGPDLIIKHISCCGTTMLGMSEEEIIDLPLNDVIAKVQISDEDGQILRCVNLPTQGSEAQPQFFHEKEYAIIRADGKRLPVMACAVSFYSPEGSLSGAALAWQEVSKRVQTELALRESEERFRSLAENANAIIGIVQGAKFVYANSYLERLSGYTKDELLRINLAQMIHPDNREVILQRARNRQLGIEEPSQYDFKMITKSGEIRWLNFCASYIEYHGKPAIVGIALDLTEHKVLEEHLLETRKKLEESNWDLEQFAYFASHDLQEPLVTLSGYMKLLQQRYSAELNDEAREFIDLSMDAIQQMQAMIRSLLDYSHIDAAELPDVCVDMNLILKRVCKALAVKIHESNAVIKNEALPKVHGHPEQLTHLLQNIICNALKFVREQPPRVEVGARETDGEWQFYVSDNGIGVELEHRKAIFAPFQRVSREKGGSGIGLTLCKRIVNLHGGRIWLDSTPGEGSTFYFTLPKAGGECGK